MKKYLFLIIALLGLTTLFFYLRINTGDEINLSDGQITPTPEDQKGIIEGSISFPSETIPGDMIICAETLEGSLAGCTEKHIEDTKYAYRKGYQLEVPEGKYYVYAMVPNFGDGYKAYYNEFVTCGLSVECTDHTPIVVEVKLGQTTENIDPQDWYNQPTPTPE